MENDKSPCKVDVVRKETPFQGYFKIERYHLRHQLFDGDMGPEIDREVFERGHAVSALLYDPAPDRLVFIEQFRMGAYAAKFSPWYGDDFNPWLTEIVAGIIEDGEDPDDVIRRETVEETGCQVEKLKQIFHYLASPGGTTESVFCYVAQVDSENASGIHGVKQEGEDIRVFTVSVGEAFQMMDDGVFKNSMTLIPMQWFRNNHLDLRKEWL